MVSSRKRKFCQHCEQYSMWNTQHTIDTVNNFMIQGPHHGLLPLLISLLLAFLSPWVEATSRTVNSKNWKLYFNQVTLDFIIFRVDLYNHTCKCILLRFIKLRVGHLSMHSVQSCSGISVAFFIKIFLKICHPHTLFIVLKMVEMIVLMICQHLRVKIGRKKMWEAFIMVDLF